jgi:hypothetical protein
MHCEFYMEILQAMKTHEEKYDNLLLISATDSI